MRYLDKNDITGRFSNPMKTLLAKQNMGNHMLDIKPLAEEQQPKTGGSLEPTKQSIKQMFKIDFAPKKNKIPQNNIKLIL